MDFEYETPWSNRPGIFHATFSAPANVPSLPSAKDVDKESIKSGTTEPPLGFSNLSLDMAKTEGEPQRPIPSTTHQSAPALSTVTSTRSGGGSRSLRGNRREQTSRKRPHRRTHDHRQSKYARYSSSSEDETSEDERYSSDDEQHKSKPQRRSASSRSMPQKSHAHPHLDHERQLPYLISGYLQLAFNIIIISALIYVIVQFVYTVQADVDARVEKYSNEILQEIAQCSRSYMENRCDPGSRVPAMDTACREWEQCMHQDPTIVGRARVSAETFAEIINSFVDSISYKTMSFFILILGVFLFASNFAFSFYKSRQTPHSQVHYIPTMGFPPHNRQVGWPYDRY